MTQARPEPKTSGSYGAATSCCPCRTPPRLCAYTLQDEGERIIFVIPWLDGHFLMVGTTDVPQSGDPDRAVCSPEEKAYLLGAYNRYFARAGGPATEVTSSILVGPANPSWRSEQIPKPPEP